MILIVKTCPIKLVYTNLMGNKDTQYTDVIKAHYIKLTLNRERSETNIYKQNRLHKSRREKNYGNT